MDLINGALEKNQIIKNDDKPLGLLEQIRIEREKYKKNKKSLLNIISQPYRKPNTNTIIGSEKFVEMFNKTLNNNENI